jgi:hypothetical protein
MEQPTRLAHRRPEEAPAVDSDSHSQAIIIAADCDAPEVSHGHLHLKPGCRRSLCVPWL